MRILRRLARETFGLPITGTFTGVLFLGPLAMALWQPETVEIELQPLPEREVVYVMPPPPPEPAEVDAILAEADAEPVEEIVEAKPAPVPVEETAPEVADDAEVAEAPELPGAIERPDGPRSRAERLAAARARVGERRAQARAAEAQTTEKKRSRRRSCEDLDGLVASGDTSYDVEQHLINTYIKDLGQATKLAAVDWHRDDDGKIQGVKLLRVRRCSPLYQAGLRSGDIVYEIEGKPIRTLPQAWAAYRKVKFRKTIEVEIERRGRRAQYRYDVV